MELIHALNRGVDRRDIFLDDYDRLRFVHGLHIFNDRNPVEMAALKAKGHPMSFGEERELLVDIHGWCLMENHYHLLLSGHNEEGDEIPLFLRKLNVGYARYFNERHSRSGTLFEGKTKKVPITEDSQFLYILHYVHLNPLDFLKGAEKWRERDGRKVLDSGPAFEHLGRYRWSSYLDYVGTKNFPEIVRTDLFQENLGEYKEELIRYFSDAEMPATHSALE